MEELMKKFQEYKDQHEAFKLKWMDLKEEDMFKWIELKEAIRVLAIELKSEIMETKSQIDKDEKIRFLELKWQLDEDWKKLTEKSIDSTITLEFKDKRDELNAIIKYRELLLEFSENVIEYINVVKLNMKNELPF